MIPRIKHLSAEADFKLKVTFDDEKTVLYDVAEDIKNISEFKPLETVYGLWKQVQLDSSRTCVFWNDIIDLPSDAIYEAGKVIDN